MATQGLTGATGGGGGGGGAGSDTTAIHTDTSAEISGLTEKASPVSGDLLVIEDSAASNAKKKVQIGNLPGGGNTLDQAYDQGGAGAGREVTVGTGLPVTLTLDGIGGNDTADDALLLQNTTASPSSGNEQNSPAVELLGTAYDSGVPGSQVKGSRWFTECMAGADNRSWMRFQMFVDNAWVDTFKGGQNASSTTSGQQLQVNSDTDKVGYAFWGAPTSGIGYSGTLTQVQIIVGGTKYFSVDSGNCTTVNLLKAYGGIELNNGDDVILATTTGSKIGTATTQKLGFWNVTPVVQPSTTGELTGHSAGAVDAVYSDSTFTGNSGTKAYTLNDVVKHLKAVGILAAS